MKQFTYYIIILTFCYCDIISQSLFKNFNKNKLSGDEIIAEVGPIGITAEEYFYSYEFGPSFPKKYPNSKSIHLNYLINEKLLVLEAVESGELNKFEIENVHNDIVGDIATEELFKDEILELIQIDSIEIIKAIKEKSTEIELKWLFTSLRNEAEKYYGLLQKGTQFDSLFYAQINDSVFTDQRSLKMSLFELRKKNPELYNIYNTLKTNKYSKPILAEGGWYVINLVNQTTSLIQTESEYNQHYFKSLNALSKSKMDSLSDLHVNNLMLLNKPIIKREAFNVLRSYIGKFVLDSTTFIAWELVKKKELALKKIGLKNNTIYNDLILVESLRNNFTLDNFINWYRNRELHLKFQKSDLIAFSKSLENMVWRMVRDNLLIAEAKEKDYYENDWVKKQSSWWKDKITYSVFKNELLNSVNIANNEITIDENMNNSISEDPDIKSIQKIFQILQTAKKKYPVKINHKYLEEINVSNQNDPQAIELYTAKNGGLIPRPAYPSIDNEWAKWQ